MSDGWEDWPALPDLFPKSFPGVKTSRDGFLVDVDLDRLRQRVADYFDHELSDEEIARRYSGVMDSTNEFDARAVRAALLKKGGPIESGFVHYDYRPFDTRWIYWEGETKLLDRPRTEYKPHVFGGNPSLVSQQKPRREWGSLQVIARCPASTIFAGWRQSVLPVHLLGLAPLLGSVGPVAGDVKLQDDGVVHDPVNRRGGGHRVGEDALPLREDQV